MISGERIHLEAVIFDFDGTLVDLNIDFGMMRQGVEAFLGDYGIEPDGLRELYILEMIDEATKVISKQNPLEGSSFYRRSHELVTDIEVRAAQRGAIFPGVLNMLKLLGKRGVKIGVITRNCERAVKMVFPEIERYCDIFVPRDDVTLVKPHPDHLTLALKKLSVNNAERCFMVGDHVLDIEAGKRAEMKTAGVLTGKTTRKHFIEAGADLILDDATKIQNYIFEE